MVTRLVCTACGTEGPGACCAKCSERLYPEAPLGRLGTLRRFVSDIVLHDWLRLMRTTQSVIVGPTAFFSGLHADTAFVHDRGYLPRLKFLGLMIVLSVALDKVCDCLTYGYQGRGSQG